MPTGHDPLGNRIRELESQLTAANAERDRLKAENDDLKMKAQISLNFMKEAFNQRDNAQAQNTRYREALERIANEKRMPPTHDYGAISSFFQAFRIVARVALASQTDGTSESEKK